MYLPPGNISAAAADSIDIPLLLNNPSPLSITLGLDSIDLTYTLNTDIVSPILFIPAIPGIRVGNIMTTRSSATFTLYFPQDFAFTGETNLGKLRSKLYVADSFETDIAFSGNGHTPPCASILTNSTIHFSLAIRCGDSMLSNLIKYGPSFSINSIVPNPARNAVQINIINHGNELKYEFYDALGNQKKNGILIGSSLQIDLSELSAGSYYFRLSGKHGMPITKKIIITK